MNTDELSLNSLISTKRIDWNKERDLRIALRTCSAQLKNERNHFQKLKNDFLYNLQLLKDRDRELQKRDLLISKVNSWNLSIHTEACQLRVEINKLKNELSQEERERERLQLSYQKKIQEQQAFINKLQKEREKRLEDESKQFHPYHEESQQQMTDLDESIDHQSNGQSISCSGNETINKNLNHEDIIGLSRNLLRNESKINSCLKEIDNLCMQGRRYLTFTPKIDCQTVLVLWDHALVV